MILQAGGGLIRAVLLPPWCWLGIRMRLHSAGGLAALGGARGLTHAYVRQLVLAAGASQFSCMWPLQQSCLDFFTWPLSFKRVHQMLQTLLRRRPGSHRALLLPHSVGQSKSWTQPDSGVGKNGPPRFSWAKWQSHIAQRYEAWEAVGASSLGTQVPTM